MKVESPKRFALLQAAKDSDYVKKVYGGYFNVFVAAFGEKGETWDLFRVVDGEFPGMDELHKYDGFVISGSPFDAYGNDYWILKLCFLLQTLDAMEKKVLGICFGHQVLCRALGGRVQKSSTDKTGVEMFKIGNHIMGIQGHPEYTKDILSDIIDRLVKNNSIQKGFGEYVNSGLLVAEPDRKCWERICRNFLKMR
ncbi:Glutamine amidotransferase [Dillenia turbinata]|uniref:Glutamine amidotransferase n=1 Tax=Dillenia turbinata TaxID=194707 RepID=A0AAN8W9D1_9MAGN